VATATAAPTEQLPAPNRPNLVSVGTIVWLSSELMFFAALFAMYFTVRQVSGGAANWPPADVKLNVPFATVNTLVLVSSSITCQLGVFAAERGDVNGLRRWFTITYLMGAFFVSGQVFEYTELVHEGLRLSDPYGSVFFLTTGFHAAHVTGGLVAFLLVLMTTYFARRFDHDQATRAIVVSYYWHFVDVVWIALFFTIYFLQ
jgi:cytochrome c oxidase subunit 3